MLLPLKLICPKKDIRKDGCSLVSIQYCYSSEHRINLKTGIAIPPEYWDNDKAIVKSNLPAEFGAPAKLNIELKRVLRIAEDIVTFALINDIINKGEFVKNTYHPSFDVGNLIDKEKSRQIITSANEDEVNKEFFFQLDKFIEVKISRVSESTIDIIKQMKHHLQEFDRFRKKKTQFESLDYDYYDRLIDFLTYNYEQRRKNAKGLKLNTIGKTIKWLRSFVKDRAKRKIIPKIDLSDFKIPEEEPDAIYLSYEEVSRIYNLDLSGFYYLEIARKLFVLACLTGLRFSDFSTIRFDEVRNGFLHRKQEKSDHWVVIPLRREAKQIVLDFFTNGIPCTSNVEFNLHIKALGKLAGIDAIIRFSYKKGNKTIRIAKEKYEWITSHTGRRSFCTNEFLAGTPVKLIMQISGHKKEKDFYKYIRITPEEAAIKIQELWVERNAMSAFGDDVEIVT